MDDKNILNYLNKNLRRKIIDTDFYIAKTREGSLKKSLKRLRNSYIRHKSKVVDCINDNNYKQEEMSQLQLFFYRSKIGLKRFKRYSESDIAKMVIKASTDDLIGATKLLSNSSVADEKSLALTNSYINHEQTNIDSLKEYL